MAENITRPSYEKVESKVEVMDTPYDRWISPRGSMSFGVFLSKISTRFRSNGGTGSAARCLHHARWRGLHGRRLCHRYSGRQESQTAAPYL